MTVHIATTVRTSRSQQILNAIDAGAGPGKLRIYSGAQPANANTAASGTLLFELVLQDPCGTVSDGVLTFDVTPTITDDALATATAGWGRFVDSNNNAVLDGAVGDEIILSDVTQETGQTVTVVSVTLTEPV